MTALTLGYLREPKPTPPVSEVKVEHAGPTVIKEMRALARLETASLHVEKVIELKDHQKRLHGLVDADDSLLFVAAGEVVLGVDLSKLGDDAIRFDETTKIASIDLPNPEVLSTRFDEAHSYVHSRKTDVLAHRNESLESSARKEAQAAFTKAGQEPRNIESAKAQAERQLRTLAKAWGAKDLVVTWTGSKGEVTLDTK